jgi:hypothetical protein
MDPISLALVTAVGAGITSSLSDATKTTLVSAYTTLKNRLLAKLGSKHTALSSAITLLEATPDSQARQGVLVEEITASKASQDPELLQLAEALLKELKQTPTISQYIQKVEGNYNAASQTGSATINFNTLPKESH